MYKRGSYEILYVALVHKKGFNHGFTLQKYEPEFGSFQFYYFDKINITDKLFCLIYLAVEVLTVTIHKLQIHQTFKCVFQLQLHFEPRTWGSGLLFFDFHQFSLGDNSRFHLHASLHFPQF